MLRTIVCAVLFVSGPAAAVAADCPIESMNPVEVRKLIDAAPTCEQGLKIFQSCGWGATSDVVTSGHVIEKCEAVFAGKLSAAQKRSYSRAQRVCENKHANESGSEYASLRAFCSAEAAARMAKQVAKTAPATPARK
jgi:hypothetical protein